MKIKKTRSIQQIIEEQVAKWETASAEKKEKKPVVSVVTLSREAGCGAVDFGQRLAQKLGMDLFDQEITQAIAENTHMRTLIVESLDERRISAIEDMILAAAEKNHLWRHEYFRHLVKVIATIGKHGRAVIIGRGANFILPGEEIFRVRMIAPVEMRTKNIAEWLNLSLKEAKERVVKLDADRKAFIKDYFHADIDNPQNYDLMINLEKLSLDDAVGIVKTALKL